jgi:16S rRNA (cytosine967-C5)-methyltransferase
LAARYAHPEWLVMRWAGRFGLRDTERLLDWNNAHPALVVQPARRMLDDMAHRFSHEGVEFFAAPFNAGLVVSVTRPALLPGFAEGDFFVQDAAQALVTRFAAFPAHATVYDSCAAPGGKTLGLSGGVAAVLAADVSRRRIRRLRENLLRAGRGNEILVVADAARLPIRPVAAMLLDAPCLGTGTFARHPDARLRVTELALDQLAQQQGRLLEAAANRIAPGGVLCYATCSLEPEENEMQVDQFLQRHPEFSRHPSSSLPVSLLTPAGDLQTLPQVHGVDGAFAARLVRAG